MEKQTNTQYSHEELEKIINGFSESKFAKDKLESAKIAIKKLFPKLEKDFGKQTFVE